MLNAELVISGKKHSHGQKERSTIHHCSESRLLVVCLQVAANKLETHFFCCCMPSIHHQTSSASQNNLNKCAVWGWWEDDLNLHLLIRCMSDFHWILFLVLWSCFSILFFSEQWKCIPDLLFLFWPLQELCTIAVILLFLLCSASTKDRHTLFHR